MDIRRQAAIKNRKWGRGSKGGAFFNFARFRFTIALIPADRHTLTRNNYVSLCTPVFDHVSKDGHVLLAIFRHFFPFASAPPFDRLNTVAGFRGAESVFRQLIELHAMSQLLVQHLVDIEGAVFQFVDWDVGAENFKIEAVSIEGDYVSKRFQFAHQFLRVRFIPAAEGVLFVPSNCDSQAETTDVSPSAGHFVRKPKRFDIQIDFPIKKSRRDGFSFEEAAKVAARGLANPSLSD